MRGLLSRLPRPTVARCLAELPYLVAAVAIAAPFFLVFTMIRGCANENDGSGRYGGRTYDISPDGNTLLFRGNGEGESDLYLLDVKTQKVRRLAETPEYESSPCFSPDGKSVAYGGGTTGERGDHLYLRSIDRTTVKQLTNDDANDSSPRFSPDGTRITFSRNTIYNWGGKAAHWGSDSLVFVINTDGTGLQQLTSAGSDASGPRFSADGKSIVYNNLVGMASVAADGSGISKPWVLSKRGRLGDISPDGKLVVYEEGRYYPDSRIYIENIDGTGRRKLGGDPPGGSFQPRFKPDGKSVLFFIEDPPANGSRRYLWETDRDGTWSRQIADSSLFNDPGH